MRIPETRIVQSFVSMVEWFAESLRPLGKMILLVAFLAAAGWLVMVTLAK